MTAEHKEALAVGREQGRAVRRYLEALETHRPKRGRKRTPDSIKKRLAAIDTQFAEADALTRLHMTQERIDLSAELEQLQQPAVDISALEEGFVKTARDYGSRKGISYAAWRDVGVDPTVLKKAGIRRGGA
ncbi:MAG: hypothetical protein QOG03_1853 [Actinomycetota bacterium]|nr:hypothetical protein [Actinomycetota bacterium]